MKCDRCRTEISEDESYSHQGQTLCEDCYIDTISPERTCDPWATYLSTQTTGAGLKSIDSLTETEREFYEFIKSKGRATKEELMAEFSLSGRDLDPQLKVLMHAELIKERSEGGTIYLIPVPISQ